MTILKREDNKTKEIWTITKKTNKNELLKNGKFWNAWLEFIEKLSINCIEISYWKIFVEIYTTKQAYDLATINKRIIVESTGFWNKPKNNSVKFFFENSEQVIPIII